MTTEIRLIFRHGATATLPFEGTFAEFQHALKLSGSKQQALGLGFIAEFPKCSINVAELAVAYVYSQRDSVVAAGPAAP